MAMIDQRPCMTSWLAVRCWSERRAIKALTEAELGHWRPTTMICAPMPKRREEWSRQFFEEQCHKARQKPPQALSMFSGYIFTKAPENGYTAISDADGVVGYLTSNGLGPRMISLDELVPAILYVYAHALTHIRLRPSKRRKSKPDKGFDSLSALLDASIAKQAA